MKLSLSVFITSYGEQATTSFWDVRFRECAQARVPQGSGPSLGVRKGSVSGGRTGTTLTLLSPDRFSASSQGWEASAVVFSAQIEAQTLQLSDSEELDVVSANARDTEDSKNSKTSSSYRAAQKQSAAYRSPPPKDWGHSKRTQPQSSKGKADLRTVFILRRLQVRRPDTRGLRTLRTSPQSRAVNTSFYGARLPSMSSGVWSANPATSCASGRSGLRRAQAISQGSPGNVVALVCPPPLRRVSEWSVQTHPAGSPFQDVEQEVKALLEKGAIEYVPHSNRETSFFSRYFIVTKKDEGLHPILDLRVLNDSVMQLKFKMLTFRQIVPQIRSEDWFVTIDLKDAYFHISILPYHRRFLFAFIRFWGQSIPVSCYSVRPSSITSQFHEM